MTTPTKTFADFLATDVGREACKPVLYDRMINTDPDVASLKDLVAYARERWPDHYADDPRKDTGKPQGRSAMQALWAMFLTWREDGE
jgi:hypothetical protein